MLRFAWRSIRRLANRLEGEDLHRLIRNNLCINITCGHHAPKHDGKIANVGAQMIVPADHRRSNPRKGQLGMASKKILVIEDNQHNMKLVRALLKLGSYQMLEADNAEKGIELARRHRPDLILMDIQLPGMDGLEATRAIKQDSQTKDIPIVALTAYAMAGDDEKALNAGCTAHISKPLDTRIFLDTIGKFFAPNTSNKSAKR